MNTQNQIRQDYNGLQQKAEKAISNVGDDLKNRYEDVRERVQDVAEQSVSFVRKHPFYSLAGAAVIGFFGGLILKGRD